MTGAGLIGGLGGIYTSLGYLLGAVDGNYRSERVNFDAKDDL